MKNKFKFLLRDSLKKKMGTKSFKIINIILLIIIVGVINIDSVIKFFGGDFDEEVNIYVIDEVGIYDEFEGIVNNSYLDVLKNYNSNISKTDKTLEELEGVIKEEETKDIVLHITPVENKTYESIFNVDFISYEKVDTILYTNIVSALNTVKISEATRSIRIAEIDI